MTAFRTLHQGAGFARGWTEKDVDGLDGWVALVDGRIGLGACPGRAVPEPVVHAEAWEAGATLHPARTDHAQDEDEPDDQEHGLLSDVRGRSVAGRPG
ncbi:hypothetical protein C7C46_32325 [Streptomyces tateyamensis]|uniref:Uncharacterized protein n=1 Tax=Streptomyces tateyamensis TaxID=565073 RepID=A0A2V4NT19_9ACTN|nr:hypothetical protein [Streptomyces tateyamensis]PYC65738.1 hypothetical protein C7C46_32325 [Streptomyces tateyamensis]